ncbi:MAG: hypothetical protein KAS72_02775 [Phycisphaerales bacterium]|nr:hypothetical protein [Phycisphaerales bacterium]
MTTAKVSTDSKQIASSAAGTCPVAPAQSSSLRSEWRKLLWGLLVFAAFFALPLGWGRFDRSIYEALALARWYAQEHVLLCLVPAFFIVSAIAVFVSQTTVMRYLGPAVPKPVAYGVALHFAGLNGAVFSRERRRGGRSSAGHASLKAV